MLSMKRIKPNLQEQKDILIETVRFTPRRWECVSNKEE
ncbi:hypothetical protein GEOBRER4_n1754 [Citrifermentans bremense]|uniref:Uncharacterized protein n=1 Tax=Citrifermentans bremense TaxID=60035 RepID=A0A7R7FS53_9BACT|nr:hypothetical protein GEOBRER4_n1754 [Citrifermentans bremense]